MSYLYCYAPLANPYEQIRLLKLNPTSDNGSVLTGSLTTHTIPFRNASRLARFRSHMKVPGYVALSYVWGTGSDLDRNQEIIVDGRRFPIMANLHAALQQSRATTPIAWHYWVDAICINQADDDEKSAQVPLMRDIYHLSLMVLAWLGKATDESDRVFRFIDNLVHPPMTNFLRDRYKKVVDCDTEPRNQGKQRRPFWETARTDSERLLLSGISHGALPIARGLQIVVDVASNALEDHIKDEESLGENPEEDLEALKSWSPKDDALKRVEPENFHEMARLMEKTLISETDYFNRMWTLQEICAGSGLVVRLQRGTNSCTLDDITSASYYLQREHRITSSTFSRITQLNKISLWFNHRHRLSLKALLYESRGRVSANPRDKIYALQGLMKDEMNPLIQPNYSNSVAQVFANAARHIISVDKSLDGLCGHQLLGRLEELPSWTPDFRQFGFETASLLLASSENIIYHASRSEKFEFPENPISVLEAWETLNATGICLATVSRISDIPVSRSNRKASEFSSAEKVWATTLIKSQEWSPVELESIKTVSSLVSKYNEFYHDADQATFWSRNPDVFQQVRSLTEKAFDPSSSAVALHSKYLLTLLCGRTALGTRCKESELEVHMTRVCISDEAGIEAMEKLCQALEAGVRHRRLIITADNNIGAAPEEARSGDLVCVLVGCSVPVILRKTPEMDEYQFVGECYFHGFMDGEALTLRDQGILEIRSFTLR